MRMAAGSGASPGLGCPSSSHSVGGGGLLSAEAALAARGLAGAAQAAAWGAPAGSPQAPAGRPTGAGALGLRPPAAPGVELAPRAPPRPPHARLRPRLAERPERAARDTSPPPCGPPPLAVLAHRRLEPLGEARWWRRRRPWWRRWLSL